MNAANKIIFTSVLAMLSLNSYADGNVSINVTGRVVASPCTTLNGGSSTLEVPLGDIQATTLSAADSKTEQVKFSLPLAGCPFGTTNVKATFSGTADTDVTLWKNTATTPATNTAVELSDQMTSTVISNGSTLSAVVTDGSAVFQLQARAVSNTGSTAPGDIASNIVVAFEYQ